jgi:arylesterase/paraoxonase
VPANFHPHGISLYRDRDGHLTLMVINHRAKKSSVIEIFDAAATPDQVQLFHRATIEGSLLLSPNDLVAVDRDRFYVTNDRGSTSALGLWLERNLLLARSKLVYFDGSKLTVAADGIQSGNGIGRSPDGTKIYVAELSGRQFRIFKRDQFSGALTAPADEKQRAYALPLGIDNIDVAPDGSITVSGHIKIPASRAFLTNPDKPSPSVVYLVNTKDGYPVSSRVIFADDGTRIGASSIGVRVGNRLIIGSPYEKKILDCRL